MSEFETLAWATGVGGAIFFGMWLILQDFKKGAHKRIDRLENVTDETVRSSITKDALDRFERNMNTRLDGMQKHMDTTNSRLDDLVMAIKNGGIR